MLGDSQVREAMSSQSTNRQLELHLSEAYWHAVVRAARDALQNPARFEAKRFAMRQQCIETYSWDAIASRIGRLIVQDASIDSEGG